MVTIIFETHSTTLDNETGQAAGHYDVALSERGRLQAKDLGLRYLNDHFDAIFCSDLQRSYQTAELAFGKRFPIIRDARLRECNYGDLNRHPKTEIEATKATKINVPFPNGESYTQTTQRIGEFLHDLLQKYDGKRVMVIGHRATQYGLEHFVNHVSIHDAVTAPWKWQPGWKYEFGK